DVKPHNILLDENGRPKISDFGIARALDATYATRTGSYLGTALYSPPEQLKGEKVTPKSDVYSLGATLYHAATGQPPFAGAPIEIASQHVSREPTPPRELNDAVSPALEALILDCMKKDPDARPSADEVRLGLLEAGRGVHATEIYPEPQATGPTRTESAGPTAAPRRGTAQSPPGGARWGRRDRRGGILVALAVVAVLAVIGALAVPGLIGGGKDQAGGEPPQNEAGQNPSGGGQNAQAGGGGQQAASQPASASAGQAGGDQAQASGGSSEAQAAERTVQEFYTSSSAGNYDRSAQLLSESWRQSTFPNRATFEGTFDKVESVEFIEGPTAERSGDTATVTGRTRATLTDRVELNEGTWSLVKENGEWKIDGWTVNNIDSRPA
ncbi:MAG TPA: protein kinase, partial [Rubrobacteraceae bacterium]|nr:protein kinase [Rubrobacteraceae bacterium]